MKKAKLILSILTIITSLFVFTLYVLMFFHIEFPYMKIFVEEKPNNSYYYPALLQLALIVLTILINFKKDKGLYVVHLIVSLLASNVFSIILAILILTKLNEEEKKNPEVQEQLEESYNKAAEIKEKKYVITNPHTKAFVASMIIISIYLLAYLALFGYIAYHFFFYCMNVIDNMAKDLGPAALILIIILPIMFMIILIAYIIIFLPVPLLIFTLKINYDAYKQDHHAYYVLRILGFLTLTFVNAIASIKIIKEIEAQDNVLF